MCRMFIIFGFALHAIELLMIVFALRDGAKVHSSVFVVSGAAVAFHIEFLSPGVEV
jgi:hypothetical protein